MFPKFHRPKWYLTIFLVMLAGAMPADGSTGTVQYTYDQLGRVTTALYGNGVCVIYTYDANGNRTAQTNTAASGPATPTWGTGVWGCFPWTPH